ncbi:hypothetical protein OIDMADRAFT_196730 [Oidiodendron maius Zn]|uniref:HMG box domain-containing protein n=1 Tax=Oidiodendron maius (strain Zn) TaxID=913774 RepID=A0A0C3HFN1_OIDMZ|nr:hypothetical protein OIDMADRAFT_196730 [Oidiodendron maius Zn]
MLSTIARAAAKKVGAGAVRSSTNRVFQSIWHSQRLRTRENTEATLSGANISFTPRRTFATATKAHATSPKPRSKTSTKKKASKKPKKVTAKPKAKSRPKKVLTPEEKKKLRIKELKAVALSTPKLKPSTAWTVLVGEEVSESAAGGKSLASSTTDAAAKYKSLSPSEVESYNRKANSNKAENETLLRDWIKSYTPEQIRLANNARGLLKKLTGKSYGHQLQDDRIPKRLRSEMALFAQDRWASGDLKGVKLTDAAKLLRGEFLELPEGERKAYRDRAIADRERYVREYKAAFNRDPEFVKRARTA